MPLVLEVVKGISFTAGKDEIVIIPGSKGAGKTTTLRSLSSWASQHQGRGEAAMRPTGFR